MSLLKVNEVQNYNGSSLTLTASTVSTSAQLNTGGNISVTGSLNVSDDSTTRSNLGLGSIATQAADNVAITGGNISNATLATSNTFPSGQPLNLAYTVINSSSFNYASTGAQVNCTNITVSLNKTKTSSKLLLQYSIPFRVYWGGSQYYMDGDVWWKRSAPSTLDNQYPQHVYYADELAANAGFNFYRNVSGLMLDTNAATGTHTYVFQIDANSTTTGGYFGTTSDTTSTGFLLLTEIS